MKENKGNTIEIKTNGAITKVYIDGIEMHNIQSLKFEHKKAEELATIDIKLVPQDCKIQAIDIPYVANKIL